jgi:hypothetical protein
MEVMLGLLALGLVLGIPVIAIAALVRASRAASEIDSLRNEMRGLETRVSVLGKRVAAGLVREESPPTAIPEPRPRPEAPTVPTAPQPPLNVIPPAIVEPAPAASGSRSPGSPPTPAPQPTRPSAPVEPPPRRRAPDLATNLGPKILVAVGALAVVIALGFFVKYAWENEWVGPTGRVLFGCIASLGMIAAGLRLMDREYRPLGQGLAGAGLAGLYTSAYGAHGFYSLVPRETAGFFLVTITACAILLSARLDARLLAALAWVGGYLTPFLLSTGEDKAVSLFLYLFLLGAGALILDHRKPWPETAPLAMLGTLVLYGGWYVKFIGPQRFDVAAFGIVLFSALFALGLARKERDLGVAAVYLAATFGLTLLAVVDNRPGTLLVLSLLLAAAAFHAAVRMGWGMSVVAGMALGLPYVAWCGAHAKDMSFGMGAAWLVAATLLYVLAAASRRIPVPLPLEALALVGSGLLTLAVSSVPERPLPLLALLLAQAGIAVLAMRRWEGAELTALLAGGLSIAANFNRFFSPGEIAGILRLALPFFAAYLLTLVLRDLVQHQPIGRAGVLCHLANAAFVWTVLYRVLYTTSPGLLGLASVGLAILYFVLGVALVRTSNDPAHARTALGLAAVFVTLAIPVQLGLNGITLAWAGEAVVLLALGVRFASPLARGGGYGVLGLAVVRLFVRHAPLHAGEFRPFLNVSFATWLAVIAAVAVALYVARAPRQRGEFPDNWMGPGLSALALVLLFGVFTFETRSAFGQQEAIALQAGDAEGVQHARLMGGLAVSVLWSGFATALLASGLALKNRPLFYAAYGLFALAAGKVVLVDLAELHTLYRILSFLALGVLLMAGAYLNIRFRARLLPGPAQP